MGDPSLPLFSVIIPTRDDPALTRAVRSVVEQTLCDLELIVVDDGSDPPVDLPIDDERVRLARHPVARGPAAARNTGLSLARARYVALLDSDDWFRPERLERALEGHHLSDVVIVRGGPREHGSRKPPRLLEQPRTLLYGTTPHLGMTSVRRNVMKSFDEAYLACQDVEWWIRMVESVSDIAVMEDDLWVWGRSDHRRILNGPSARLAFSYRLLREHRAFFDSAPQAKAFRWRRVSMMETQEGNFSLARRALARAVSAHFYPKSGLDLLRQLGVGLAWEFRREPMELVASGPLPPVPRERATHWRPLVVGSAEARMRPTRRAVGLTCRATARLPRWLRGRLRRLVTLLTRDPWQTAETSWGLMRIPSYDTSTLAPYSREPLESAVVARLLNAGDVAIDVGANLGWYTNLMAQRVGPTGRVISVEPISILAENLKTLVELNGIGGRVSVLQAAVAQGDGHVDFSEQPTLQLSHVRSGTEIPGSDRTTKVPGIAISDLMETTSESVVFLKIDVEGFEPLILKGLLDWLEHGTSPPLLMFEANDRNYQRYGFDVRETLDGLRGRYDFLDIDYSKGGLVSLPSGEAPRGSNVIAVPHGRRDEVLDRVHGGE